MVSTQRISGSAKIVPSLWYVNNAEEAARFYASVFPDSSIDNVTALPVDSPGGPAGSVKVVNFTLAGQSFIAMSAGKLDAFNHAVSFTVNCEDQAEVDRFWKALSAGGTIEECGWLKDRYGVSWQIIPVLLGEMLKDSDRNRAKRVADAMLKMKKIEIAGLKRAYDGARMPVRV
jgi:predicted 3-demethylubiquinone-9 3-methyltransferase (glyoxalase superfamily)